MPRISIVDDDPSVREALGRLVESVGYDVETFASAWEFLDSSPPGRADCLVLDIHLEGMSGFELQERLAATRAALPIILITAHDDAGTRERSRQAGGPAPLYKPIEEQALLDAIRTAVGGHRPCGGGL
jgi:FixJ family two-component response regulator